MTLVDEVQRISGIPLVEDYLPAAKTAPPGKSEDNAPHVGRHPLKQAPLHVRILSRSVRVDTLQTSPLLRRRNQLPFTIRC